MLNDQNFSFSNFSKCFYFIRQVQVKPIFCKHVLQSQHRQFLGFDFLSLAVNSDSDLVRFKSNRNVSQHFGPK